MSPLELVGIALFGAAGAMLRHHLGGFVHESAARALASERHFPFGTLAVNVFGSFVLGLVGSLAMGGTISPVLASVLGNGFCGAVTTFSTVAVDVERFLADRRVVHAVADLLLTVLAGVGAAWIGMSIAA